jgi:hypothetical protein
MRTTTDDNGFRFPIGTTFRTRHKHPRTCTVVDRYTTTNERGEVVDRRYVCTHEVSGQIVTDYHVPDTTIAMGLINGS